MAQYEQMLSANGSTPAFTQSDLSGSARMAAGVQVQNQSGSSAFEVALEQWIPRTDGVAPDRAQTDIFTATSPYRVALNVRRTTARFRHVSGAAVRILAD